MLDPSLEDNEPMPRRPQAHAPFAVSPLLIVALGALLFLLMLSGGFNVWFVFNPQVHFHRDEEARRQKDLAVQLQRQAEDAAQRAVIMQQEFQRKHAVMQREIDDLTRQLEAAKEK